MKTPEEKVSDINYFRLMNEPRIEYLDTIKLRNGTIIKRYRHYFSGKMEIIEEKLIPDINITIESEIKSLLKEMK